MDQHIVIAAFYKFVPLPDYQALRQPWLDVCNAQDVYGSILLAAEGVNGTIAGSRAGIDAVLDFLRQDDRLRDLLHKESFADFVPFQRMKIRLKKEIVTLKVPVDPTQKVGTYVEPEDWNQLIADPEVILIDTRNAYEYEMGTFSGAVNPDTRSFGEFPDYVERHLDPQQHKKVAMFCTGGIRCEKATAYMLQQGFEEVYHLKGGILRYLENMPAEGSAWEGNCFVFDERTALDHALQPVTGYLCQTCQTFYPNRASGCDVCDSADGLPNRDYPIANNQDAADS